jgi:aspartyl-tRNA(Asn)/glutamyl-tRNA(Gln) amidotransferase subunit B
MNCNLKSVLERYPSFEATIGMEVHVQLKTASKMFCSCPNKFGTEANKNICSICTGLLGTLPVINRKAVDFAIMAGVATNCKIAKVSEFSRKHYSYPDLPKNYQITQDDKPICENGVIKINVEGEEPKTIRIMRIHMEEDAGKNIHTADGSSTMVDLNRAGTPLIEIVSMPDLSSAAEVRMYLERIRSIVRYIGVSDANMEEGSFRADVNVSVKQKDASSLGTRVEVKNVNSFKFIEMAIDYEIDRQLKLIERGGKVTQDTRLWNSKEKKTVFMRSKENCEDYRYYPDPDLPLLIIDDEWVERIKGKIPELPEAKKQRLQDYYSLSAYEADVLTTDRPLADFFEEVAKKSNSPKLASNWILRDLLSFMNESDLEISDLKITTDIFSEFVEVIDKGVINSRVAQDVFSEMAQTGKYPSIIIQEKGLEQIDSQEELEAVARKIVDDNPGQVEKFKSGNERIFGFFVGQAMKATEGKANPVKMQEILRRLISKS